MLEWTDGASIRIRLDHGFGFGYWKTKWSKPFGFAGLPRQQAAELRDARFGVEPWNDQYETILYVGQLVTKE